MNIHLGVSGVLFSGDGKVLMGKRCKDDASFPGCWCTPGGGVDFGETLEQALAREFMEEVKMRISFLPCAFMSIQQRISAENEKHSVLIFFRVFREEGIPQVGDGFDEVDWFTPIRWNVLNHKGLVTPSTYKALEEFKNHYGLH